MTLDEAKVREWLTNTDGYNVFAPAFFREMGFSEADVERLSCHHSGDERLGKYAIQGKPDGVRGIAEFDAVDAVAQELGVEPCRMFYGRGKTFRATAGLVLKAIEDSGEDSGDE